MKVTAYIHKEVNSKLSNMEVVSGYFQLFVVHLNFIFDQLFILYDITLSKSVTYVTHYEKGLEIVFLLFATYTFNR